MSSESNTERLIDLMYGESTNQEKEHFLEEIAESGALQREHAEIRTLLGDIGDVWSEQTVSSTLHNSIMDAAKSAANERAEKKNFVTPVKRPGLWSRLSSSSQMGQIAMVATVVIAGAFVFRFVNFDDKATVHEDVAVFIPEKGEAQPTLANKPSPVEVEDKDTTGSAREGIADGKVGDANSPPKQSLDSVAKKNIAPKKELSKRGRSKTSKKRAKAKSSSRGAPMKKQEPSYKTLEQSNSSAPRSSVPSPGITQNKAYFDELSNDEQQQNDAYQKRAESAEKLTLVPAKTIDSVTSKYGARDYSGTIQAADEFVGLKSGTRVERARALQLKAQSLANLGRYPEALRVYDSILKNYKTFQSSAISSARAEISRKLEERNPAKKNRKAKSKSDSYEFNSESVESKQ